jgi:hypothetical protein
LALTNIGCRLLPDRKSGGPDNVAESSSTSFIIDEPHRFRLELPGEGWSLINDGNKNSALGVPAALAYDSEQGLSATISVGRAPQASLPAYVDDWLRRLAYLDKKVLLRQEILFQNCPAESFDVTGIYLGQDTYLRGVFLFHQNYVYRLLVRGSQEKFDSTRAQRFFDSFKLLAGKVHEAADVSTPVASQGVGWRIRDGQYESAITGLSVVAPPGWQLLVGNDLREFSPDSDVAVVHDDPDASLAIRVRPAQIRRPQGALSETQRAHSRNLHVSLLKDVVRLPLMGSERVLQIGRTDFGNLVAYGNILHGDREIELVLGYSELYRAAAQNLLEQVAAHIQLLSEPNRRSLQNQLLAQEHPEHVVANDISLRSGCYYHYSKCFEWCRPPGFWEVVVGSGAQRSDDRLLLIAKNVQLGLEVQIYSQTVHSEGLSLFQHLSNEQGLHPEPPQGRTLMDSPALFASGLVRSDQEARSASLSVFQHHRSEIGLLASCVTENFRCRSEMAHAVDSIRVDDCRNATEVNGDTFVDRRFGFSLKVPASFRLTSRAEAFGEAGQRLLWSSADAQLTLVALVPLDSSGNSADFLEAIDQATRATVPPALLRQAHRSTMAVTGEIANRTSYVGLNYRFESLVLKHKRVLLAWLFAGRNADGLGELVRGLEWLD